MTDTATPRPRTTLDAAAREWGTARGIVGRPGGYLYATGLTAYDALPRQMRYGTPDQRGRFALVETAATSSGRRPVQGWHSLGTILRRLGQITVSYTDKGHARYTAAPLAPAPEPVPMQTQPQVQHAAADAPARPVIHRPVTLALHTRPERDHRPAHLLALDSRTLRAVTACGQTVHPDDTRPTDPTCPECAAVPAPTSDHTLTTPQARMLSAALIPAALATTSGQHEERVWDRLLLRGLFAEPTPYRVLVPTDAGRAALAAHVQQPTRTRARR